MENNNQNQNLPPSDAETSSNAAARQRSVLPGEASAIDRIRRPRPPAEEINAKVAVPLPPPPQFRWAGERRCSIHTLEHLIAENIKTISGEVLCKKCGRTYKVEYDLQKKFSEIRDYVTRHAAGMRQRAHTAWMEPPLVKCQLCKEEGCVGPNMPDKKRWINWLFLLLGQMLGVCDLHQLKYFCRHSGNVTTGSKDVVLFRVYLALCRQLSPDDFNNL